MNVTPSDEAVSHGSGIWGYIERTLSDEELLHDLGFPGRDAVKDVVVILRAGNRLHPTKGFNFLGPDWKDIEEETAFRLLGERQEAVEDILEEVLGLLETQGYEAARRHAESASEYQVLYMSRSETETQHSLQQMFDVGLGRNELSDDLLEKCGDYMVHGFHENLSYYMFGTGGRWFEGDEEG